MPNVKSAKKRVKTNLRDTLRNRIALSTMRTSIKKVNLAMDQNDVEQVKMALPMALSQIGKNVKKGVIHRNNGARKESRLMKRVNQFMAAQQNG